MLTLQDMSDRLEIQDLLNAYTHAIDGKDWDALDDIFAPDATIDYSATGGIAGTLAEAKAFLQQMLPMFQSTQHIVSNPLIRVSGDTATCKSLLFNPVTLDRDGAPHTFFVGAWYWDDLVRTEAGWRTSERAQELAYFHNQ